MKTLEGQLADYGDRQRELHGPIDPDELIARRSLVASVDKAVASAEEEADEWPGDELTVDYLQQRPDERHAPSEPTGWIGIFVAVAATILLVVGIVVVADGNSGDVVTDPASSPTVADPVSSPQVADPGPALTVVDSLGYRWSRVPHDETLFSGAGAYTEGMSSVTAGGPGLVVVGTTGGNSAGAEHDPVVWTSVDGITWSRSPNDDAILGVPGDQEMTSVTIGGPGLVAVGVDAYYNQCCGNAVVWTSVDGITWSRVPHDEAVFGAGTYLTSVAAGGPGLVAVGWDGETGSGAAWTSVDGITWSRVPHDLADLGDADRLSVSVGGPGLVAVGQAGGDAAVWTSVDGLTWSRALHDEAVFGGTDEASMFDVTVGGPGLVAVGSDGFEGDDAVQGQLANWARDFSGRAAVWTSVDGITWSRVPHDEAVFGGEGNQWMSTVTAVGPGLVAVGGDWSSEGHAAVVWTSIDGITWSRVPHDEAVFGGEGDQVMSSVTAAGSVLVAVGESTGDAAVWVATAPEN